MDAKSSASVLNANNSYTTGRLNAAKDVRSKLEGCPLIEGEFPRSWLPFISQITEWSDAPIRNSSSL